MRVYLNLVDSSRVINMKRHSGLSSLGRSKQSRCKCDFLSDGLSSQGAAQSRAAVSVNLSDGPKRVRSVQCENVCN